MLISAMLFLPRRTLLLGLFLSITPARLPAEPFVHTIRIEATDLQLEPSSSDTSLGVRIRGKYIVPVIDPLQFTLSAVSAKLHWGAGSHAWCTNRPGETLNASSSVSLGFANAVQKYEWDETPFSEAATSHTQSIPLHWQAVSLPSLSKFRTTSTPPPGLDLNLNVVAAVGGELSFGPFPDHPSKFTLIKLGQLEISYTLERAPGGWENPPVWWNSSDTPRILSRLDEPPLYGVPFPDHLYTTFDLPPGLASAPRLTSLPNGRLKLEFLGVLQTASGLNGWWSTVEPEPLSPYIFQRDPWKPKLFFRSKFD